MHQCLKLFYFGMTLYMFRMVFPSIIRSSRLYIQQQVYVKEQSAVSGAPDGHLQSVTIPDAV